ncbi:AAA family ATPase [Prosthecobacter vanneervenii]|uniref:MoxR-like ATPase n=1 Tax=Prosthecobacter vanneervenii TaxID=48466 RepID=A0A7W7Y9U6_9BACT|nr:MoxR family ATPase [Prosthecobacter vanneervenii]MBB5032169.1 MoxR-like ATPase [Prosthecobacter vanneervenii]
MPPPAAPPAVPDQEAISKASFWVAPLRTEIARVLVGQTALVDRLLVALLTNGHVLLEGVPGIAKTLAVRTLSGTLKAKFQRIQFTPDLLPADVIGTMVYHPKDGTFTPRLGPIFANLVLADEINRAPAKVQSALLEAMQERQVTIGENTHKLPDPFMVLATQNPIDQEGTYTLPEAQLDRFLLKVRVTYPTPIEERQVLDAMATSAPKLDVSQVADVSAISASRVVVNALFMDEKIRDYIVALIHATRHPETLAPHLKLLIRCGASPRGTINLALAAKALAFLNGRNYVIPQDIKDLAPDILRHRILLSYEAEAEGVTTDDVIKTLLDKLPVP